MPCMLKKTRAKSLNNARTGAERVEKYVRTTRRDTHSSHQSLRLIGRKKCELVPTGEGGGGGRIDVTAFSSWRSVGARWQRPAYGASRCCRWRRSSARTETSTTDVSVRFDRAKSKLFVSLGFFFLFFLEQSFRTSRRLPSDAQSRSPPLYVRVGVPPPLVFGSALFFRAKTGVKTQSGRLENCD